MSLPARPCRHHPVAPNRLPPRSPIPQLAPSIVPLTLPLVYDCGYLLVDIYDRSSPLVFFIPQIVCVYSHPPVPLHPLSKNLRLIINFSKKTNSNRLLIVKPSSTPHNASPRLQPPVPPLSRPEDRLPPSSFDCRSHQVRTRCPVVPFDRMTPTLSLCLLTRSSTITAAPVVPDVPLCSGVGTPWDVAEGSDASLLTCQLCSLLELPLIHNLHSKRACLSARTSDTRPREGPGVDSC